MKDARFQTETIFFDDPEVVSFEKLTEYALACGYIQKAETKDGYKIELHMESEHFHIRVFFYDMNGDLITRLSWDVFDSYEEAQEFFKNRVACL